MAVDGVSNNSALYAGAGAVVGAGAGAAAGYLTKPYLKDGAPTDAFIKKATENMNESEFGKSTNEPVQKMGKEFNELLEKATSVEELKKGIIDGYFPKEIKETLKDEEAFKAFKEGALAAGDYFKQFGLEDKDGSGNIFKEGFEKANNIEDVEKALAASIDKSFEGKSLEDIKKEYKAAGEELAKKLNSPENTRKAFTDTFNNIYDSTKKEFIKFEDGSLLKEISDPIKKAAKSIQGKYTAIYAGVGAVVLGAVGYLLGHGSEAKAAEKAAEAEKTEEV